MSQRVEPRDPFYQGELTALNRSGRPVYLCDCCWVRQQFATRAACDAHETNSAAHTTDAECGIYPDL